MKKNYSLVLRRLWQAPATLLLLAMLAMPSLSWGQTFTETFGTAGPKPIIDANAAKDFDNDQFTFGGNSSLIASDPFIPASPGAGRSFIYFGDFDPATGGSAEALPTNNRDFTIFQINTNQLTNIQLSFRLFVDPAIASSTGDFVVEYSTNPGARTPIYTNITSPSLTTQGWRQISVSNPFNGITGPAIALRFRRLSTAGDYIAIDDVQLTGTVAPNFAVSPTSLAFPNTAVNGRSTAQNITVTGSGLTNNISVVAPAGFLIRQQGTGTYGTTLALAPTSGSVSTVVEVVFSPTSATDFSGQITFDSENASRRTVAVSGKAVSPTIIVTPTSLAFGSVEVNTQSGVQSIAVEGSSLSSDINVQVPSGYEFRKAGDATFLASGTTLTLAQTNGNVNASVEVRFAPTTTGTFNGNATFISTGATTQFVAFTGTSVNPAPVITVSPSAITFPPTQVGRTSNPISFSVSGQNLDNNTVIVNSPSNEFQIRRGTTGGFSSQVILTGTGGTLASTEIQVQFSPAEAGGRAATIAASSGTTVNQILQVNGNALAASTTPEIFITPDPAPLDFGSVAANGSAQILTFRVGGTMLGSNPLVLTPASSFSSNENIEIREANVGDFQTSPLVFQSINGGVTERTIQVRLTGPLTQGQYQGTITASSPTTGAPDKVVNVVANSTGNSATVSVNNTLQIFSTVPTVASAIQSFQVNGSGLVRDITVRAPAFFQVSLSADPASFDALGGTTGNTVTVVRNNVAGDGLTNPVMVYVRYLPATANPQPDLASINVTSEPAIGAAVQVEGFSAPSIEVLTAVPEIRNVESGSVSASFAVTIRALRVRQAITIAEVLTDPSQFNNPLQDQFEISLDSNTGFGPTVTFAPNQSTYSVDQVIYVRYKPTHLGNASSKLQSRSQDFDNKGFQDFASNTGSIRGNALDNQPTAQTTIDVVRNGSTATVSFTPAQGGTANGAGEGRLIIASLNNDLDGNSQPQDGQTYLSEDGTIGQGRSLAPGYFSVYTGTANQATVKGLDPTKAYYFYVFDYNYVTTNTNGDRLSVPNSENYRTPTPPNQLVPVAAVTPGTAPLPVELTSFTAKLNKNQVNLAWETASEKDNKGFEVQRSGDGVAFTTILFKNGQGSSTSKTAYAAVDGQPLSGVSYYRLKQLDYDGKTSLSPVVSVTNRVGVAEIEMYPNPAQSTLNIRLPYTSKAEAQVTITDLSGRVVRTEKLAANSKVNMSSLSNGTYLVTVNDGVKKVTRRIVKN